MIKKYDIEGIRNYWRQQAEEHGLSPRASWSDKMVIEMEIREINKHLSPGDHVLDVGCANGYSTIQYCAQRELTIRGVDCTQKMIESAIQRLDGLAFQLIGNVEFVVGDIMNLIERDNTFDKVISTRVLINLGNWDSQLKGLNECIRVLKPGGTLLLSEATIQGWRKMNELRREWGLPDIPMPPFNTYLDELMVKEAINEKCTLLEVVNFASTYYVGTRVLKPLLVRVLGIDRDVANPDMEWNRWFADLPAWGDYGTQKLFIIRKK